MKIKGIRSDLKNIGAKVYCIIDYVYDGVVCKFLILNDNIINEYRDVEYYELFIFVFVFVLEFDSQEAIRAANNDVNNREKSHLHVIYVIQNGLTFLV